MMPKHNDPPAPGTVVRIGISRCLLGEPVRFDGGHKHDRFLADVLSRYVEWVPVCPEVEAGLGVPREPMRLVGDPRAPRLVTIKTGMDRTQAVTRSSRRRLRELEALALSGYVFKKDSPSCGMERVRLYSHQGIPSRKGMGIFARLFQEHFPLVPVEEEDRLQNPLIRENFIERVFAYRRWRDLLQHPLTRKAVAEFHARHTYLLLAHSREQHQALIRLIGSADRLAPAALAARYGALLMEALKVRATARKHVNVLNHMAASFTDRLSPDARVGLRTAIDDFHKGLTPLIVPLTLVKHYVRRFAVASLESQVYLNPHPQEVALRNHARRCAARRS